MHAHDLELQIPVNALNITHNSDSEFPYGACL